MFRKILIVLSMGLFCAGVLFLQAENKKPGAGAYSLAGAETVIIKVEDLGYTSPKETPAEFSITEQKVLGDKGLLVKTKSKEGFATVDTPEIQLEPDTDYTVTVHLYTETGTPEESVYLMVREFKSFPSRPLQPYAKTPVQFRKITEQKKWFTRAVSFKTKEDVKYVNLTVVIGGNPFDLTVGGIVFEKKNFK